LVCLSGRDGYVIGCAWWALRWPIGVLATLLLIGAIPARRMAVVVISAATLGLTITEGVSIAAAHARAPTVGSTPLTLVTHNVLFEGNALAESLAGVRDAGPDVIAFQEITPTDAQRLITELGAEWPHHVEAPHPGANGFALFSRLPLSDVRVVRFDGKAPFAQCVTVALDDGPLPVCNVHLSAPSKALKEFRALPDLPGLEQNAARRTKEWSAVSDELRRRGSHRAVALGDFNSLEAEPLYRSIREEWVDAFRELHLDWGATWPNSRPFARIDYVFSRGAVRPIDAKVISRSGSDHLAVAATLIR
jgi:vancomycin resistance protein VanJ